MCWQQSPPCSSSAVHPMCTGWAVNYQGSLDPVLFFGKTLTALQLPVEADSLCLRPLQTETLSVRDRGWL